MNYRFDGEEMLATAKVVFAINPSVVERFDSPEELVEQMQLDARVNLKEPSYLSIFGYVLTSFNYPGQPDTLGIKASLSTYTVGKHLKIAPC